MVFLVVLLVAACLTQSFALDGDQISQVLDFVDSHNEALCGDLGLSDNGSFGKLLSSWYCTATSTDLFQTYLYFVSCTDAFDLLANYCTDDCQVIQDAQGACCLDTVETLNRYYQKIAKANTPALTCDTDRTQDFCDNSKLKNSWFSYIARKKCPYLKIAEKLQCCDSIASEKATEEPTTTTTTTTTTEEPTTTTTTTEEPTTTTASPCPETIPITAEVSCSSICRVASSTIPCTPQVPDTIFNCNAVTVPDTCTESYVCCT